MKVEALENYIGSYEPILNLTKSVATDEQIAAGVVEIAERCVVNVATTFYDLPCTDDLLDRAYWIASIAALTGAKKAMVDPPHFFASALESALASRGIKAIYAFYGKNEEIFTHIGFVEPVIFGE
jgi:hypothetical protein